MTRKVGEKISHRRIIGTIREIYKGASKDIWKTDLFLVELQNGKKEKWAESILDDFKSPEKLLEEFTKKVEQDYKVIDSLAKTIHKEDELSL